MPDPTTETLDDGSVRVPLSTPLEAHGEEHRELVLRAPAVRDLKAIDGAEGDVARAIALIARLAQVPPSAIEAMRDLGDFARLSEAASGFLAGTGLAPSASEA